MRWLKIFIGVLLGLAVCFSILLGAWMYWFIYRDLPSIQELKNLEPTRLSQVIASDGKVIGSYPPGGMIVVNDDDIPELFKQAFIAAEDSTFYDHVGIDVRRIVAALIADVRANSWVQGASTITQQVTRSYLLSREKTITRKIKEAILAIRIERALTKDQILNLYLNRVYLGSGAYGIGAASIRYFDKECRDLSLAEMAMIAGLAPAPARYSPLNDFLSAKRRQNYVLKRMIEEGYVGETEAGDAYKQPLMIKGESVALFSDYPYVTQYIRDLVTEKHGEEIFSSGIKIQTFISPRLQDAAIQAVRKGVTELEMKVGKYRGPQNTILEGEKERVISEGEKIKILSLQANQLSWQGPRLYQLYWGQVKSLSPFIADIGRQDIELGPQSYSWINPRGKWKPSESLKPGDMIRLCSTPEGFILFHEPKIQAALVAFDLETSGVIAMVGGVDYAQSQFNRAVYAKRQSGSAIKPFIYSAAIDKGFTPSTIIFDTPITLQAKGVDEVWSPKNFEEKFYGETTLRTGLVLSRNVVTVKILKDIGIDYAISYLKQFDLSTAFPRDLSLALGTGVIVPYNLFKGYGVFASYGKMFDPTLIQSIEQHGKGIIYTAKAITESVPVPDATEESPENERGVISEQTAYIITNILSEAVSNGTGWRAKVLGRPVAGKTGTSDENRDAWFVGYTPEVLCGVWVGYDDNTISLGSSETGGTAACPIFADFMLTALGNRPVKDFRVPDGIVFTKIDAKTGRIADETSTDVRFECYKADSFPEQQEQQPKTSDDLLLKEIY